MWTCLGEPNPYDVGIMIRYAAITLILCSVVGAAGFGQQAWLLTINDDIGPWTVTYMQRGISEATSASADILVLVLSTPGGDLDSAVKARSLLLDASLPTVAYVSREALSAGALLAITCERIFFAPGGVMGAATPVYVSGWDMKEAPEKIVSATRTLFRSSAEQFGRSPEVAEAMVDRDVAIPDLIEEGKLLTLTSQQALEWGYSDGELESIDNWLDEQGITTTHVFEMNWVDRWVEFLTSPVIAGILIAIGILGLLIEMLIPGFGFFGFIGILGLAAFFWAHALVGLAGWESIAFLAGGVVAILLEIFAFTAVDFGITGLVGLILVGLGFHNAMVGPFTSSAEVIQAIGIVAAGLVVSVIAAVVLLTRLPRTRLRLGGMILSTAITGRSFGDAVSEDESGSWVGRSGVAITDLRPVGVGEFDGERVDVTCEEGHLPKGTSIIIVKARGYQKIVRELGSPEEG